MTLPPDILSRSPAEGARSIALQLLAQVRSAAQRLEDPEERDALHDFRVAVRRLRSTLHAWSDALEGSLRRRDLRELRTLQAATGCGRDAEVAIAWLDGQRGDLTPAQRYGHEWLVERLVRAAQASRSRVREETRQAFAHIDRKLSSHLEPELPESDASLHRAGRSFGATLADKVRAQLGTLERRLAEISSVEDARRCHRARIACKRLRYLVEPIGGKVDAAARVVTGCRGLQDLLGDLNDAYVLQREIASALEEATLEETRRLFALACEEDADRMLEAEGRTVRAGLLELGRRLQQRIRAHFEDLEKLWLEKGIRTLAERVERLRREIGPSASPDAGFERKYRLRALPCLPDDVRAIELDEGWLPGVHLRERLRRVRQGDDVSHYRLLTLGEGSHGIRIREPAAPALFEKLWPLTLGCRIRRRRHLVRDGALAWKIDQFRDRGLVLASVALPGGVASPELPEWLAALVVRDVSGDPRYASLALAEQPGTAPNERDDAPQS